MEKARTGDREAAWFACEFLEKRAKRAIMTRLWGLGVPEHELEAAYHDAIIRVVERVHQVNDVLYFAGWLRSIEREIAANYRPTCIQPNRGKTVRSEAPAPPKEISRKWVTIDGEWHTVRVFEPVPVVEKRPRRQLRFVELSDLTVGRQNEQNRPDYLPSLRIKTLLSQLPPDLREIIVLRYFQELSVEDIATAIGCPVWKAKKSLFEAMTALRKLCGVRIIQIKPGCELTYFPQFLAKPQADASLSGLLANVPFQPERISLFGKKFTLKRQAAHYGVDYDDNPAAQKPWRWSRPLSELKVLVELAAGTRFDSAHCNLYPDGDAYNGWHHDAGHPRLIASLSVGAVRELRFAGTASTRSAYDMELAHGSLLLIPEVVNERFRQMVPKSRKVTQPRINVTFRRLQASGGMACGSSLEV